MPHGPSVDAGDAPNIRHLTEIGEDDHIGIASRR
jgi:hypothetical protein